MSLDWYAASWTVIDETPLTPAVNVALDEVLLEDVAANVLGPTLRFWAWAGTAAIIGRFQSLRNEVDQHQADEMGVAIVRRITGGGAMFVEPGRAITYSLCFPEAMVKGLSIIESYEFCDSWAVAALRELGVPAFYRPINDIACADGKIGGAAQSRRGGAVLHHTTIAYEMNPTDMLRVLRIGREKLSDKGTISAAKRVSPIARHTGKSRDQVYQAMKDGFNSRFPSLVRPLTPEQLSRAEELARTKFMDPAWTSVLS